MPFASDFIPITTVRFADKSGRIYVFLNMFFINLVPA